MIHHLNLSFSLSLLFMGFLLANILGILTNSKNIIFLFVLGIELINYFTYSSKFNLLQSNLMLEGSATESLPSVAPTKSIRGPKSFFPTLTFKIRNRRKLPLIKLNTGFADVRYAQRRTNKIFYIFYWLRFLLVPKKKQEKLKNIENKTRYKPSVPPVFVSTITSSLNFLKIGFEFGFFIDAFKLGS